MWIDEYAFLIPNNFKTASKANFMLLSQLITTVRRLSLLGLAKNTGKTETLNTILQDAQSIGLRIGVTSIGRDGEVRDIIDRRIIKPRFQLAANSLVATTDLLIIRSGLAFDLIVNTGLRTPLGEIIIASLCESGTVEIAGPSIAADVYIVSNEMIRLGADHVLIDGALDRRTAASTAISDGVIISTGAVLHSNIDMVVKKTQAAVELFRLPVLDNYTVRKLAKSLTSNALITNENDMIPFDYKSSLASTQRELRALLCNHQNLRYLVFNGALCEDFMDNLLTVSGGREIVLVTRDSTRVFLQSRSVGWYRKQGLRIQVLYSNRLQAITVNPVSPLSHQFDSRLLCRLLAEAIPNVNIFNVRDPAYIVYSNQGEV